MTEVTVKEYATMERVTPRTVRRWIDKGAVSVRRTPGGGVRIAVLHQGQRMSECDKHGQSSK